MYILEEKPRLFEAEKKPDNTRFELTVDEPDVEAIRNESYFDYLAEMDENNS